MATNKPNQPDLFGQVEPKQQDLRTKRPWTVEEDDLIRREYPEGDVAALAAKMGRTHDALVNHAGQIGVSRLVHSRPQGQDVAPDEPPKQYSLSDESGQALSVEQQEEVIC